MAEHQESETGRFQRWRERRRRAKVERARKIDSLNKRGRPDRYERSGGDKLGGGSGIGPAN
jgi:hypothetical protein